MDKLDDDIKEVSKSVLEPLFKDIVDGFTKDYTRSVDREMNNQEHRDLYRRNSL